jgi:hypothetical protein
MEIILLLRNYPPKAIIIGGALMYYIPVAHDSLLP